MNPRILSRRDLLAAIRDGGYQIAPCVGCRKPVVCLHPDNALHKTCSERLQNKGGCQRRGER